MILLHIGSLNHHHPINNREDLEMYKLEYLIKNANNTQTNINNKWVPGRPEKFHGIYGIWLNIKDAYQVLTGKADAFTWPEGQ